LNDQYARATIDQFLDAVESASPTIQALGITDYFLTRQYKRVREQYEQGRLADVRLLFCNVELRLSIETKAGRAINLHLLVSPDDDDHIVQADRFLSRLTFRYGGDTYGCSEQDLVRLGQSFDPSLSEYEAALRAGANQFKADFEQLRSSYEQSEWAQSNILIAVAGSSNDGTAGLQNESSAFAARRKEIEAFAHIIFTPTPRNISFWRGEGVLSPAELQQEYGGLKPCLHGSDAHRLDDVGKPDEGRYCWIKGDATFEALRQACIEPRTRVQIARSEPDDETLFSVVSVSTPSLEWLVPEPLPLNPGMIAIIGARGSGKTALADLIAHAAGSPYPAEVSQSFLSRASELLLHADVRVEWSDSSLSTARLASTPVALPDVNYLTQQFVDRLCSAVSESDELLDEVKRVVFLAHDPAARLGADDFDSLVKLKSAENELAVEALERRLDALSEDLRVEREWWRRRTPLQTELAKAIEDLRRTDESLGKIIRPSKSDQSDYYARLSTAIAERERSLQQASKRLQALKNLEVEIGRYHTGQFVQLLHSLRTVHSGAGLTDEEWGTFRPRFSGDPYALLTARIAEQEQVIESIRRGSNREPASNLAAADLSSCSLDRLRSARENVGEGIAANQKALQRLEQLNRLRATQDATQRRVHGEVQRAEESPAKIQHILAERAALYGQFFDLIVDQSTILSALYQPLAERLARLEGSASKLSLRVIRNVNISSWANDGEALLDLRKHGEFRGRGSLEAAAIKLLMPAWREGTAAEASTAVEEFRSQYDNSLLKQAMYGPDSDHHQQWIIDLARWLYSTDHIRVHYSIEYEGVPITQLSPGTRGIVLLLLYLALDLEDSRPLIIDQPEENLDPKSVFAELIQLFREARLRRQVIIVTHNANLVVNADVDQVIVASCTKAAAGRPPTFTYKTGGLENATIRAHVCEILEGGEAAFKERAKRLRVSLQ
jgi:energy-coupling factor transporter ATP-binding protein EcfA2